MAPGMSEFWLDEELADMDVVLALAPDTITSSGNSSSAPVPLSKIPGHRLVLAKSPYLKAQVLRWQRKRPAQPQPQPKQPKRTTRSQKKQQLLDHAASTPLPDEDKPQVVLTLQDAAQEPAARAVLASLYDKPLPELLSGLSQEQQLSAAVLADMWDVLEFSQAAADGLLAAALSDAGLEDAVSQQLFGMPAVAACLLPILAAMLQSTYGDLEAVWRDSELQKQLLALPLHAMEALLSSDKIKVASEDTVLYTAQRYVDSIEDEQQQQAARQQLAPLIRCQYVSTYWLSSVLSEEAPKQLLYTLRQHVQRLLMLRPVDKKYKLNTTNAHRFFPAAPSCWSLPQRPRAKVNSVELTWSLPVSELRAAAVKAANDNKAVRLKGPDTTPPLRGMAFGLRVVCSAADGKARVGVHVVAVNATLGGFWSAEYRIAAGDSQRTSRGFMPQGDGKSRGWSDLVVGPMAGGWDEQKLTAKGVPTTGNLDISLRVTGVGHG